MAGKEPKADWRDSEGDILLSQPTQLIRFDAVHARLQRLGEVSQVINDPSAIWQFARRVDREGVYPLPSPNRDGDSEFATVMLSGG